MKHLFASTSFLLLPLLVWTQPSICPVVPTKEFMHGNQLKIDNISLSHILGDDPSVILNPLNERLSTRGYDLGFFSNSLWLGGLKSTTSELFLYADQFPLVNYEFSPGSSQNKSNQSCKQWNKIWKVTRHDIEQHLIDWNDNGSIDEPIPAILGWPGKGNAQFEAVNGFGLPYDDHTLAPFFDANGNGIYEPLSGEYPHPADLPSDLQPSELLWMIFHPEYSKIIDSVDVTLDVQHTLWSMRCDDDEDLNFTVFGNYRLINFDKRIDSCMLTLFHLMCIGNQFDDGIGTMLDQQAFYVFNLDSIDINAQSPNAPAIAKSPPAFGMTMLSRQLDHTIYLSNDIVNGNSIYNYMNGHWGNGEPITAGGTGLNQPSGGLPVVNHIFTGDPNDPDAWAMTNIDDTPEVNHMLGSVYMGSLATGEEWDLDYAYVMMSDSTLDHLENVTALRERLNRVRQHYAEGFIGACNYASCANDCVWPGDANLDGIVNNHDILPIGVEWGKQGPARGDELLLWAPAEADDWGEVHNLQNDIKHMDAGGNGLVDSGDAFVIRTLYNQQNAFYNEPTDSYPEGPELFVRFLFGDSTNILPGWFIWPRVHVSDVPDLYGLSFTFEYDTELWERVDGQSVFGGNLISVVDEQPGEISFGLCHTDGLSTIAPGYITSFEMDGWPPSLVDYPDSTLLRFKNIRGIRADGTPIDLGAQTKVIYFDKSVSTQASSSESLIQIAPNPARNKIIIQSEGLEMSSVELFNGNGSLVLSQTLNGAPAHELNVDQLPRGMYMLRVQTKNGVKIEKVVLK